jgi:hypothetical protein
MGSVDPLMLGENKSFSFHVLPVESGCEDWVRFAVTVRKPVLNNVDGDTGD